MLIFKICPRTEWNAAGEFYYGSAHDRADGFLHFSLRLQLIETLRRHYAGADDLVLIAVEAETLDVALRYEYVLSRGKDFPHLYGTLPRSAVKWTKPITRGSDGNFIPPV